MASRQVEGSQAVVKRAVNARENLTGQINGWKQILNTLTIHYGDRVS